MIPYFFCLFISSLYFFYPVFTLLPLHIRIPLYLCALLYCLLGFIFNSNYFLIRFLSLFLFIVSVALNHSLSAFHIYLPIFISFSIFALHTTKIPALLRFYFIIYVLDGLRSVLMNILGFPPIIIHPWSLATYSDSSISNLSQYTSASIAKISTIFPIPYTHVYSLILSFLFIYYIRSQSSKFFSSAFYFYVFSSILVLVAVQTKSILLPLFSVFLLYLLIRSYIYMRIPKFYLSVLFFLLCSLAFFLDPVLRQISFYADNSISSFYFIPSNLPPLCIFECPSASISYTEFHFFAKIYQFGLLSLSFVSIVFLYVIKSFVKLRFSLSTFPYPQLFLSVLLGDFLHYVKVIYAPPIFVVFLVLLAYSKISKESANQFNL